MLMDDESMHWPIPLIEDQGPSCTQHVIQFLDTHIFILSCGMIPLARFGI